MINPHNYVTGLQKSKIKFSGTKNTEDSANSPKLNIVVSKVEGQKGWTRLEQLWIKLNHEKVHTLSSMPHAKKGEK